jgi:hypothetical protein
LNPRLYAFLGGATGPWRVLSMTPVTGEALPAVARLSVVGEPAPLVTGARWSLRGTTSNDRYVVATEKQQLAARQQGLGRVDATCAALIPIRKTDAWWALPQDERRRIFEERSGHTRIGLRYLPAIARRLHHCRDLGSAEPFDFLTWFEYAPEHADAFEALVAELRATAEWQYVDREIDIRLMR